MSDRGGRIPLMMMLLGMAVALAALFALFMFEFAWIDLVYYLPALALAGFLIFIGRAKLKRK